MILNYRLHVVNSIYQEFRRFLSPAPLSTCDRKRGHLPTRYLRSSVFPFLAQLRVHSKREDVTFVFYLFSAHGHHPFDCLETLQSKSGGAQLVPGQLRPESQTKHSVAFAYGYFASCNSKPFGSPANPVAVRMISPTSGIQVHPPPVKTQGNLWSTFFVRRLDYPAFCL
jgi:hypothetical protein